MANYKKTMLLRNDIYRDPNWALIDEICFYGGRSDTDIDVRETYYNSSSSKALCIYFNQDSQQAGIKKVSKKELKSILHENPYVKRR